ncbi:SART-1 family protein DOT2, partial [Linum perenne]
ATTDQKKSLRSVGEGTNKSEAGSGILSWLNKTRKLEEKRNCAREKAKRLSKKFEEQDNLVQGGSDDEEAGQDHHTHDLAGVKILDGLDKVIQGGAVVLTLKDQSILAADRGDINNEVDMLENVEIGEQKRRDYAYKAAKKPAGVYSDKFNDDPMAERKMLPQYDDEPVDEGVTLDIIGHFSGEAEKKLEELRRRLQAEDANSSGKILSDYYSQEEMIQFKKPKKKKSFLQKKDKLDMEALEQEAISEGLGAGDLGSRNDRSRIKAREEQDRHKAEMRNAAAYQLAYAKADEASKALQLGQTIPDEYDDDDDLHKSVERARKLALKKQKDVVLVGPDAIARLATTFKSNQMAYDQEEGPKVVVFTEIEEFVSGLQFDQGVRDDTKGFSKAVEGMTEANETVNNEDTSMEEDMKEVAEDGIIREVPVGKGLSGTLKLLHDRATLKESINWGGRNMDKKKSKLVGIVDTTDYNGKGTEMKKKKNKDNDMDRFSNISLERTDEFGQIMTPKEAFRVISHRFHGKGPGKMKLEKRMKQFQEEQMLLKQMNNSDTPLLSVERMRETQAQLKTPYLVLSGHVKPRQTRDRVATVEKEIQGPVGSTPMLVDQKVEHSLGMKRKWKLDALPKFQKIL